jgi:hypothetical protein
VNLSTTAAASFLFVLLILPPSSRGQDAGGARSSAAAGDSSASTASATANENDGTARPEGWAEFTELVISYASDFGSPLNSMAIEQVAKYKLVDQRIDDAVLTAIRSHEFASAGSEARLRRSGLPSGDSEARLRRAISVLPLTRTTPEQRVSALLELLAKENFNIQQDFSTSQPFTRQPPSLTKDILTELSRSPAVTAEQLNQRLQAEDAPALLYLAAEATGAQGSILLPQLLKAAGDDDLKQMYAFRSAALLLQVAAPPGARAVDSKHLEYAQRIIGRADKNKDGVLTVEEWREMLVDPSAADVDGDGRITVEEYARWLKGRSAR